MEDAPPAPEGTARGIVLQVGAFGQKKLCSHPVAVSGRRGYTVIPSRTEPHPSSSHVSVETLSGEGIMDMKTCRVRIKSGEKITGPIFFHKGKEFICIISGTLSVVIGGEEHLIRKGESMILESALIEKWSCHGRGDCDFIYILF